MFKPLYFTIKSRKLNRELTFFRVDGGSYVYINLNGEYGTDGNQICKGGRLIGVPISYYGNTQEGFKRTCRSWLKQYLLR